MVIASQQDTNLKGANINAEKLQANIHGNLTIESQQDTTQYHSKQTQAGASASFTYGSGGGGSVNLSKNNAKVNQAQVEQQSGISVGKGGMDVVVGNNTHLKGGVIQSQAEQDKNHFTTNTLTTENIENHSEIKVESISAGISSNMAQTGLSAVGTLASALGNKNESNSTTTQSAIGDNINLDVKQGTPKALSRDITNTNQKVTAYDLEEVREQQELVQVMGKVGSRAIGDLSKKMGWEDGSPQKLALHGFLGTLTAKAGGGNVLAGLTTGALNEYVGTELQNYLAENTQLKPEERKALQQFAAVGLGAAIGATAGSNNTFINSQVALNAEKFNRELHESEKLRIKELAKGDKEKEKRLTIAACAMVHCSAQIPKDNPNYIKVKEMEEMGNTNEFKTEREQLEGQLYSIGRGPLIAGGFEEKEKLFVYDSVDKIKDKANQNYQIGDRVVGLVQGVGGAGAMATGTAMCETGVGCTLGAGAFMYGADNLTTGVKQLVTGKKGYTLGAEALSRITGIDKDTADLIYSLPSLGSGAKVGLSVGTSTGKSLVSGIKQFGSELKYVGKEIGVDVKAGASVVNDIAQKGYVKHIQNGDYLTKVTNITNGYLNKTTKMMAEQPKKIIAINAVASGGIEFSSEASDYIVGNKEVTKDNLVRSTTKIINSTGTASVTTGLPFVSSIVTNMAINKVTEGDYKVKETTQKNLIGEGVNNYLPNNKYTPVLRELIIKGTDILLDYTEDNKNEKK